MGAATPITSARVISTLRAHEPACGRQAFVRSPYSVPLRVATPGPIAISIWLRNSVRLRRWDVFRMIELEFELGQLLGRRVVILPEPVESPRLRSCVEADSVGAC
jgi:hypothetical protein